MLRQTFLEFQPILKLERILFDEKSRYVYTEYNKFMSREFMYQIIQKRKLAPNVTEYVIVAPKVTLNASPGQFVMVRLFDGGERVPFTLCDSDTKKGTITLLVQEIGYTTRKMAEIEAGGYISDIAGPLGEPTSLTGKKICLVGGGIGTAVIYPQAKKLHKEHRAADVIIGARTKELLMYEEKFQKTAKRLFITTDDGSYIRRGFVTDVLKENLDGGANYDEVLAVGPMPMMRAVYKTAESYGVKTMVSMNSIMVDGTGMCGGCRLTVGGKTKYACVDGPEFDASLIDWDEAILRQGQYKVQEAAHLCRLTGEVNK